MEWARATAVRDDDDEMGLILIIVTVTFEGRKLRIVDSRVNLLASLSNADASTPVKDCFILKAATLTCGEEGLYVDARMGDAEGGVTGVTGVGSVTGVVHCRYLLVGAHHWQAIAGVY